MRNIGIGRGGFVMFGELEVFLLVELVKWIWLVECVVLKGEKWD